MTREEKIESLNIKAVGIGIPYLADKLKWKNGNIDIICYCNICYNYHSMKSYVCCNIIDGVKVINNTDYYCSKCGKKINWDKTIKFYEEVEGFEDGC